MGNATSLEITSRSVCCISLEDTQLSDENTIKITSNPRGSAANLFTREEKAALQSSFKATPESIKIENENSFSSISSKSSSKSIQQEDKLQKMKKNRFTNSNRNRIEIDEMRNDNTECYKVMSEEERVGISSYEEVLTEDVDFYYYSAGSGRTRRRSRDFHNSNFRNLADERRE